MTAFATGSHARPTHFHEISRRALCSFRTPLISGLQEPSYPFHDKTVVVANCGRLCLYRKKINVSTCLAGQAVGIKEVADGIWLVSFMDYYLGYIDLEEKSLQPAQSLRAKSVPHVLGTICYPWVRAGQSLAQSDPLDT